MDGVERRWARAWARGTGALGQLPGPGAPSPSYFFCAQVRGPGRRCRLLGSRLDGWLRFPHGSNPWALAEPCIWPGEAGAHSTSGSRSGPLVTGGLQARWGNSIWRRAVSRRRNLLFLVNLLIPLV